jgi:hypothetical protein
VPRDTVRADGQIVLFWMTRVFGLVLGVHAPLGLGLLDDEELPPHDIAVATAIRIVRVLRVRTSRF